MSGSKQYQKPLSDPVFSSLESDFGYRIARQDQEWKIRFEAPFEKLEICIGVKNELSE